MPLLDLQTALGSLVVARAASARPGDHPPTLPGRLDLSSAERAWLARLADTPGLGVTCYIQRWWRRTRLLWTARLTLAALGADLAASTIEEYLDAVPGSSLYFTSEALGLLDLIIQSPPPAPHVGAVARFERALILAAEDADTASPGPAPVRPMPSLLQAVAAHPSAALVPFEAPIEGVLATLLYGGSMPPPGDQTSFVLVSPGLPQLWRPASPEEARLFALCRPPVTLGRLLAEVEGAESAFHGLWAAGALGLDA